MDNKEQIYLHSLQSIVQKYSTNAASAQADFLVAQSIYNTANTEGNKTEKIYTIKQAKELLENIFKKFPQSEGGINAKNLINQILHKEINITSEKVNVPGLPFRSLVTYKNISSVNTGKQLLFYSPTSFAAFHSWVFVLAAIPYEA